MSPDQEATTLARALELAKRALDAERPAASDWEQEVYWVILLGNLGFTIRTAEAIALLCRNDFHLQAHPLCRALFETWLDVYYLSKDWKARVIEYLRFDPAQAIRLLDAVVDSASPAFQSIREECLERRLEFKGQIDEMQREKEVGGNPNHWSGLTYSALAKKLGPGPDTLYRTMYKTLSWRTHPSALALRDYLRAGPDEVLYLQLPPAQSDTDDIDGTTAVFLLHIAELFARETAATEVETIITSTLAATLEQVKQDAISKSGPSPNNSRQV